ncbi:MAG: HNH endonuclease [Shewanella sp.]
MTELKSKARQKFLPLVKPSAERSHTAEERMEWINKLCDEFVQPSSANKAYYRVVVETLWPAECGIPGPYINEDQIRDAINSFRRNNNFGKDPHKPYVDVFRRVRELQGEEGLTGVARKGKTFQLVKLEISEKRVPRTKLSDADWESIKAKYHERCPACKRKEPDVRFQQDHKVPRTRGGLDGLDNWQPLCDECNNFKSVACRGCDLDCATCCWAYPEKYAPVQLRPEVLLKVYSYCDKENIDPSDFLENLVLERI